MNSRSPKPPPSPPHGTRPGAGSSHWALRMGTATEHAFPLPHQVAGLPQNLRKQCATRGRLRGTSSQRPAVYPTCTSAGPRLYRHSTQPFFAFAAGRVPNGPETPTHQTARRRDLGPSALGLALGASGATRPASPRGSSKRCFPSLIFPVPCRSLTHFLGNEAAPLILSQGHRRPP